MKKSVLYLIMVFSLGLFLNSCSVVGNCSSSCSKTSCSKTSCCKKDSKSCDKECTKSCCSNKDKKEG